jgi:integrase
VRWAWIDWQQREINIPAEYRKGGKPQKAPTQIVDVVYALLLKRKSRAQQPSLGRVWWQLKTFDDARRAAAKKAGIAGYRHHDARHTRATHLGAAGATAIDLRDQMGWSTLAMVNRYTHPDRERLKEMASRVQFGSKKRPRPVTPSPSRKNAKR